MFLVSGARGQIGGELVRLLKAAGKPARSFAAWAKDHAQVFA